MSDKTFTYVGVSTLKGKVKARFTNDATRIKVLMKNGHTDVNFVELPRAMTKAEIRAEGHLDKVMPNATEAEKDAASA
jgi:hypothetical protein